jgi:hypothetical protein
VATIPHEKVMKAIHRLGVNFFSTRFDGTSNVMYVTNKMDTAIWYWLPTSPRSFSMLYRRELPMLTLEMCVSEDIVG